MRKPRGSMMVQFEAAEPPMRLPITGRSAANPVCHAGEDRR
ncbi:hypothetical protein [Amycolatopsis sp. CA-126428]|nr:hypothetical protein [Amycolatopsis sp. CA-126428]